MATKTAYGRLANRRRKLLAMASGKYKDDTEVSARYRQLAADIEARLLGAGVCKRCGRPLRNDVSKSDGLGPECKDKGDT